MTTQANRAEPGAGGSRIAIRRDDEHGSERSWIAVVDGSALRGKRNVRTFATEQGAYAAAIEACQATAHSGDPCNYCGADHALVPPGPCKARLSSSDTGASR